MNLQSVRFENDFGEGSLRVLYRSDTFQGKFSGNAEELMKMKHFKKPALILVSAVVEQGSMEPGKHIVTRYVFHAGPKLHESRLLFAIQTPLHAEYGSLD
jgi:hypothetical protein